MLPGVVATDAESPEDVAERCDEAGADLARAAGKAVEE
jgi:hypothetical protein